MSRAIWAAIGLGLMLSNSAAPAQELPSLYGIQLGDPLAVEECNRRLFLGRWEYDTVNTKKVPCYRQGFLVSPDTPITNARVFVMWPVFGGPDIAKHGTAAVRIVGGKVHRVEIETHGVRVQEVAFDQLVQKFGKPTASKTVPVQNRMGAQYQSIQAEWQVGEATVTFYGMTLSLDAGLVVVETPLGRDTEKAANEKLFGNKPRM